MEKWERRFLYFVLFLAVAVLVGVLFVGTYVEAGGYQGFNQWWGQPCGNAAGCPSLAGPPAPTWSFPTDTPFGQRIPQYALPAYAPAYGPPVYGGPVYSTGGYAVGVGGVGISVEGVPTYRLANECGWWSRLWGCKDVVVMQQPQQAKVEEKKEEKKSEPKEEAKLAPAPVAPAKPEKPLAYIEGGRDEVRGVVRSALSKGYDFVGNPDDARYEFYLTDKDVPDPLLVVELKRIDKAEKNLLESFGTGQARFKVNKKGQTDHASFREAAVKAAAQATAGFLQ